MKLIVFLLKVSWHCAVGRADRRRQRRRQRGPGGPDQLMSWAAPTPSATILIGLFTALCEVILLTRLASQVLLCGLTVNSTSQLRLGLCRRIVESPLRHLEEIGDHRMLASLTNDVAVISQAMNGVPTLGINVVS